MDSVQASTPRRAPVGLYGSALIVFLIGAFFYSRRLGAEVVFIPPQRAFAVIKDQGGQAIDARGATVLPPFLPGAQPIDWRSLRNGWFRTGHLDQNLRRLREALEIKGIRRKRPVVVYGAMGRGWGEEGRIWWMLRYLGHPRVYIVDGGIAEWRRAGLPLSRAFSGVSRGKFPIRRVARFRATWRDVDRRKFPKTIVFDARRKEEYNGGRPYWSARGGHIPGAYHLYWKSLIAKNQRIIPMSKVRKILSHHKINKTDKITAYCTGGVRSAFVAAVLIHAGFGNVANYDGSWWEWAAKSELPITR